MISKDYIISVIALCASHVEFVNRDKNISSPQSDLLKSVEDTLNLLCIAMENNTVE